MAIVSRSLPSPSASSPQLLTRLLEAVARGVRTTRGLQESLAVQPQTTRYYIQAAEWLDLVEVAGDVVLTPVGLEYVYAGRRRPAVYARAVWSNPLAADLLVAGDGRLPELPVVERALQRAEPDLAPATLGRRASAIRSLIAPVVGRPRPRSRQEEERQLDLPLSHPPSREAPPRLTLQGGREYDPDAYRYLLQALLDYGELSLGQLRALLDRAGAQELPIGGYVDMAVSRGDAVRVDERLAVTTDAVERRELAGATTSVMLSDPVYRAYLADVVRAGADRSAAIRRDQVAPRFRHWDQRLFGHPVRPEQVHRDLERVLMDRSLESYPVATATSPLPRPVRDAFLDVWEDPGLVLALPPYLAQLQGGLPAVNRILRQARLRGEVGLPDLGYRPALVHATILHPGEPLPRSVPDLRSLRLRTLMHAPYPALLAALLLLHRLRSELVSVSEERRGWQLRWRGQRRGDPLALLDDFSLARGWVPCRRDTSPLATAELVRVLESLGIVMVVGRLAVLEERFFHALTVEPEELEVHVRLRPLADALEAWLEGSSDDEASS